MPWCIFDTETSGLFDFRQPADAPGQPRLAQFSAILIGDDLAETDRINLYVRPDGWEMTAEAQAVHGLSTEFLKREGAPVDYVLGIYANLIDGGYIMAAYNAQYDLKVMRGEMRRAERPDLFEETPNTCLMRAAMKLGIKKAGGGRGWPKLSDVATHFAFPIPNPHDAMGDAAAAARLFRVLHARGALIEPAVHYAKNRPEGSQ